MTDRRVPAVPSSVALVPVPAPAGPAPAVALYDVDPGAVSALVLACPAVAGLSAGPFGTAATYLPGRAVPVVRIRPDAVEVHVVARYGPTVRELAAQIRAALHGHVLDRTVDVVVEDLEEPSPAPGAGQPGTRVGSPAGAPAATTTAPAGPTGPAPLAPPRPGRWTRQGRQT